MVAPSFLFFDAPKNPTSGLVLLEQKGHHEKRLSPATFTYPEE